MPRLTKIKLEEVRYLLDRYRKLYPSRCLVQDVKRIMCLFIVRNARLYWSVTSLSILSY